MFRFELTRLYELKDSIGDQADRDAYFQSFDENLANSADIRDAYIRLEHVLQELDPIAWSHLKEEACKRLRLRDKRGRGWQQLFDVLNEARAYRYLKVIGCSKIRFIPRSERRTPDLECVLDSSRVICEVKTINISDEEVSARTGPPKVRSIDLSLSAEFLKKLRSTVEAAKQQLSALDVAPEDIRLVYLNIIFDDFLAENKEAYFKQIDDELSKAPVEGVKIVFCNEHTLFYKHLQMESADVDNLGDTTLQSELTY